MFIRLSVRLSAWDRRTLWSYSVIFCPKHQRYSFIATCEFLLRILIPVFCCKFVQQLFMLTIERSSKNPRSRPQTFSFCLLCLFCSFCSFRAKIKTPAASSLSSFQLQPWSGIAFCVRSRLSVCPVRALTFKNLDLESLFILVHRISRLNLYIKVIGSRSRSQQ